MSRILPVAVFATVIGGPVAAATHNAAYNAYAIGDSGSTCNIQVVNSPTPTPANCTSSWVQNQNQNQVVLAARADPGDTGISGSFSVTSQAVSSGGAGGNNRVGAYFRDYLTFGTQTGNFLLPVDIFGSIGLLPGSTTPSGGGGVASANIGADFADLLAGTATTLYQRTVSLDSVGNNPDSVTGHLGTTTVSIPIVNGEAYFSAGIAADFGCQGRFGPGTGCSTTVSFYNSLRFLAATVLDANGNVVTNPTISSASGFDYLTGLDPHVPPVPLPAGALLLVGALGALGMLRRSSGKH